MSVRTPSRLGHTALAAISKPSIYWISRRPLTSSSALRATPVETSKTEPPTDIESSTPAANDPSHANPILKSLLEKRQQARKTVQRPVPASATLPRNTVFDDDYFIPGVTPATDAQRRLALRQQDAERRQAAQEARDAELYAHKLDPHPLGRRRWERKMVIRGLRRRGRTTSAEKLKRTERSMVWKSQALPTSVKKLTRLMHLIAGKTVEEALVQLRFSKKRVAQDVYKGLMMARDQAVVRNGMGMGSKDTAAIASRVAKEQGIVVRDEVEDLEGQEAAEGEKGTQPDLRLIQPDGTYVKPKASTGTLIELKSGGRKYIYDPTEIYIDQAWVGKMQEWKSAEYRAKGRVNLLTHRTTTFSVLLKEERTRMRISDEIQKKRDNRKLWVALPDRPVTSQRQYCLW